MPIKPFKNFRYALLATMLVSFPLVGSSPVRAADDGVLVPNARQNDDRNLTIEAVVIDAGNQDRFRVSADGETFYVLTMRQVKVEKGDHIVLKGNFDENDQFLPDSVEFMDVKDTNRDEDGADADDRDNAPADTDRPETDDRDDEDKDDRVDFPATITRVVANDEVEVRGGNGKTYVVELRRESDQLHIGNQVRVLGRADTRSVFDAVLIAQNGGIVPLDYNDEEPGQTVDFPGKIRRLDKDRKEAMVRGDNGGEYEVRGEDVREFGLGSHVRVRGVMRGGVVQLTRMDLWRY